MIKKRLFASITYLCLIFCVKNGNHQDVEKCLGFYLDALDEELFKLHNHIGAHKPAPGPSVEPVEEEARGQSEVGKKDNKVRR